MKKVLLIQNTGSRGGNKDLTDVMRKLKSSGFEPENYKASDPEESIKHINNVASECESILIAGGDGTLFHIAEALVAKSLPIGIIPLGTANNLAKNLHIPFDIMDALEIFLQGKKKVIDLGKVNGKLFFSTAHIGAGASIFLQFQNTMKNRYGKFIFPLILAKMIFFATPKRYNIVCDQEKRQIKAVELTVINGTYVSGHLKIAPEQSIADNLLELYVMKRLTPYLILRYLPLLQHGERPQIDQGWFTSCEKVEVTSRKKTLVVADGEPVTYTPAQFEIYKDALTVIVPKDFARQTDG